MRVCGPGVGGRGVGPHRMGACRTGLERFQSMSFVTCQCLSLCFAKLFAGPYLCVQDCFDAAYNAFPAYDPLPFIGNQSAGMGGVAASPVPSRPASARGHALPHHRCVQA